MRSAEDSSFSNNVGVADFAEHSGDSEYALFASTPECYANSVTAVSFSRGCHIARITISSRG
jgi:hypothetical protein